MRRTNSREVRLRVTERQTDSHTHRTTTVTLAAHARRGLIRFVLCSSTLCSDVVIIQVCWTNECLFPQEKMLEFLRNIKMELERLAKQSADLFDSTLGQPGLPDIGSGGRGEVEGEMHYSQYLCEARVRRSGLPPQ